MAMAMTMKVAVATVIALSIALMVQGDGECSANSPCPDSSLCCSKWGFCGTGPAWCGQGCQSGPCNVGLPDNFTRSALAVGDGECSANSPCPDSSLCCSQWGYCGTGPAWCGQGCQSGPCTGDSLDNLTRSAVAVGDGECSANSPCPDSSLCCSQWGYCGTGPAWCGQGCQSGPCNDALGRNLAKPAHAVGDGECSANSPCPDSSLCCSKWGFCGTGPAWCGQGCQSGPCNVGLPDNFTRSALAVGDGECSANSPCPDSSLCCSQWGYCGTGPAWCGQGCQSGPCNGGLGDILTRTLYEQFFPRHLSFYSYDKLIEAAKLFPKFGTTGDTNTRKREIAAFAAHVSFETSGLRAIVELTSDTYCDSSWLEFPCGGRRYNGRGPLQLSRNYNYGTCGKFLNLPLLTNPDLVATDPLTSFKASLWFWNQYGDNVIPNMHSVMVGEWKPNAKDRAANRLPGFGATIDVINGDLECDKRSARADARLRYFKDFCTRLGVRAGDHLDCKNMKPFYSLALVAET